MIFFVTYQGNYRIVTCAVTLFLISFIGDLAGYCPKQTMTKKTLPVSKTPFSAVRLWPKVHHCMGGLQINTKAQAIGQDRKPIKGLYAAGEITGGVHGAVRPRSCAIIDCLVFGRIAGKKPENVHSGIPLQCRYPYCR